MLKKKLNELIRNQGGYKREIVVACVGTDAAIGDCVGPIAGQMLVEKKTGCYVYGTLKHPITAGRVNEYASFIEKNHHEAIVIAVDSCIGADIGKIHIKNEKLFAGGSMNKGLKGFGDISITAIVCDDVPQSAAFSRVRLGLVYQAAKKISETIYECVRLYNYTSMALKGQSLDPVFSIRI